jgi:stalled ribosome rescue protein Dom34
MDTHGGTIMAHVHAIVWLDHREATIIGYSLDDSEVVEVHSEREDRRIHRRAGALDSGKAADDHHFFDEIATQLAGVREILIVGPGNAKTAFATYLGQRHAATAKCVLAVESVDHPTQGQLLDHARRFFRRTDQLGAV